MRRVALLAIAYVNTIVVIVVITLVIVFVVVVIVIVVESLLCSDLIFGIRRAHRRPAALWYVVHISV